MDPFIGEIRMFAGSFAPSGWALCNGQILAISSNQALFAILGTTYGGNGTTNFQLPDLRSRVPLHAGQGNGLAPFVPGQVAGVENITLTINNLPSHNHQATFTPSGGGSAAQVNVTQTVGTLQDPTGNMLAKSPAAGPSSANLYAPASSTVSGQLAGVSGGGGGGGTVAVGLTGNSTPFNIRSPLLCVNFIIALQGVFPSRN